MLACILMPVNTHKISEKMCYLDMHVMSTYFFAMAMNRAVKCARTGYKTHVHLTKSEEPFYPLSNGLFYSSG